MNLHKKGIFSLVFKIIIFILNIYGLGEELLQANFQVYYLEIRVPIKKVA